MKKLCLLMFLGILLLPAGCKKEPKPIPGVTPFPQELKDLFYFQPGTWWIYEDSISGILDTITVESLTIDTFTYTDNDDNIDGIYEVFELVTYSSHYNYLYKYKFEGSVHRQFHVPAVDIHKTKPGDYAGSTPLIHFPVTVGKIYSSPDPGTFTKVTHTSESIILLGNSYQSCIGIYNDRNVTEPSYPKTYFILAKDYGIISRRLEGSMPDSLDRNWQLKESNIIK